MLQCTVLVLWKHYMQHGVDCTNGQSAVDIILSSRGNTLSCRGQAMCHAYGFLFSGVLPCVVPVTEICHAWPCLSLHMRRHCPCHCPFHSRLLADPCPFLYLHPLHYTFASCAISSVRQCVTQKYASSTSGCWQSRAKRRVAWGRAEASAS